MTKKTKKMRSYLAGEFLNFYLKNTFSFISMQGMNQTVFCVGAKLLLIVRPLIGSTRFVPVTFNDSKLFINENVIT